MEELTINKYQAVCIENALRLAMNALGTQKVKGTKDETAMDRELMRADNHIKEVLREKLQ